MTDQEKKILESFDECNKAINTLRHKLEVGQKVNKILREVISEHHRKAKIWPA